MQNSSKHRNNKLINKKQNKTIAFVCGGTGGHFYPAIAVAQEYDGRSIFFCSKNRYDSSIVKKYGFPVHNITTARKNPVKIIKAFFEAASVIKKEKVAVLISAGGYATVPVVIAAYFKKIPVIILEQNVIPGKANRYLQYLARKICISFLESAHYFNSPGVCFTKNPIRKNFISDKISDSFEKLQLNSKRTVLVFGGSLGSDRINQIFEKNYKYFMDNDIDLIHILGQRYHSRKNIKEPIKILEQPVKKTKVIIMAYFEKMDLLYEKADVVVARAGATTISELIYFKKPALLIPYPYSMKNHQLENALQFKKQGCGFYMEEKDITFEKIIENLDGLLVLNPPEEQDEYNAREIIMQEIRKEL
ncbi:MAG: UDP-N-acetylglucosamine--N-acetylmuramyl-(pentapeptide) pyrophosphoryl-undecaprenol N-acetylglucosamine transferase [bacterium]|nr:UDP-N-acetylglucosamine--N-acetylmuramyl-(pentapeptide) pyrophosphoryl-undecaprenol N-acetylglucosamine transferase [bacterium]